MFLICLVHYQRFRMNVGEIDHLMFERFFVYYYITTKHQTLYNYQIPQKYLIYRYLVRVTSMKITKSIVGSICTVFYNKQSRIQKDFCYEWGTT